ncbi:alanyl-tRNA editing protein [Ihubacter sp. rT4E-8]|uniref:alanyl-tRNA editing protein n=1 Tax=Ihubacter sp. rT4E-8 TaxID=3242369 RepID=UPI003CF980BF
MKTKRLYREDVYLRSCTAQITGVKSNSDGRPLITLNQTIFFPTGGGQSCDLGTIAGLAVADVFEADGEICHVLAEDAKKQCKLSIGDEIEIAINWERRFDNMQRHCGEHILSGKFYELFGGINRGFHMGEEYMTIDISLEKDPAYDKVTWEMAKEAELRANEAIWANLPVITRHFDNHDEAARLPLRKALALDEDITIVCVGAIENPADCVACCGTHPSTAGQIGLIKIYKVETNKGMYRIYFEAGQRAFRQYQQRYDVLSSLENRLSAGFDDLLDKFAAQNQKNRSVRDELYQLKKWVISRETSEIKATITPAFVKKYDKLSINDLLEVGRGLNGCIPTILFLVHEPTNTVLLFSDKHDCGKLVKENADIYGGKGGGNKNSARAIFSKADYTDTFIDLIEKHLR